MKRLNSFLALIFFFRSYNLLLENQEINKPEIEIDPRELLESKEYKMFQQEAGKTKIVIGILTMRVHQKMKKAISKKMETYEYKDLIYKQDFKPDLSQDTIRWNKKRSSVIGGYLLDKKAKFSYYPTSYAKSVIGWNIFDYLSEKKGDPLVKLTRPTVMIPSSKADSTK